MSETNPIADMIAEMLVRGMPADVIVLAVKAVERAIRNSTGIPVDETAERRRAYDRDRKRLKAANSTGIPPESTGIPETALNNLPSLISNTEVVKEGKKVRARKTQLSAEFQPKPSHFEAAVRLKYSNPRQAVLDKCEDMKVWAHGKGEARADWDATLHGFLRRDAKNGKHHDKSVLNALDRLEQNLTGGDDYPLREIDLLGLPPR